MGEFKGQAFKKSVKRFLWDVSGAFGDIGVLFPIAIALSCVVTGLLTGNLTIGFLSGFAVHYVVAGLAKAFSLLQRA